MLKFKCCYHRRMKRFFGYSKYHSVTEMLLDPGLPSFDTVMHNYRHCFYAMWSSHNNVVVKLIINILFYVMWSSHNNVAVKLIINILFMLYGVATIM